MSTEDLTQTTQMLAGILNPNNTIRKEAESLLQAMNSKIDVLLYCLVKVLKENSDVKIRSLSAVLLRKLMEIPNSNWRGLKEELKLNLKNECLLCLIKEKEKYAKTKICDAVAMFAENIFDNDETWDDLLTYLYKTFSKPYQETETLQIETCLQLLTSIFGFVCDDVMKGVSTLIQAFSNYFKSGNLSLMARTAQTISEMISICSKKETKHFKDFVIQIYETTYVCIEDVKEESNLRRCLTAIIDICEAEPNLLRKSFPDLFILISKILAKKDFADEGIRELGFEVIISIVERLPKLFQKDTTKLKEFLDKMFGYSLEMDDEISNDWAVPKTESYYEEEFIPEESVSTTLSIVVRLVEALGKTFFLPYVSEVIMQLIQNEKDWRYKYIAFMTIAQIVEFIPDIQHIDNLMPIVFANMINQNSKIRYAAIYCVDLFSEGFQPHFQEKYHDKIVYSLIYCVKESVLRNQLEACEALNTFLEHCSETISGTYAQFILDNLLQTLLTKDCPISLREQILSVVTELINSCDDKFTPFAENCLKILLEFFVSIFQHKTCRLLYGSLIECITLIGPFCKEVYLKYVPSLVNATLEIQESLSGSGDFTKDYLQNAWERLSPHVRDHFPHLIGGIVGAALKQINVDVVMSISNKPEKTFKIEDLMTNLEEKADRKFNFNTAALEDKSVAIEVLNALIEEFGGHYIDYIQPTQNILLPLLNYKANSKIRAAVAHSLPLLITSAKKSGNRDFYHGLSKYYITQLLIAAEEEVDNATLNLMFENIGNIMQSLNEVFLNSNDILQLFNKLLEIFGKIEKRRVDLLQKQEKLEQFENDQFKEKLNESDSEEESDDYGADLDQDIDEVEELLTSITDLVGVIFKTHKDLSLLVVDKIRNYVLPQFLKKDASIFEEKMGLFLIDDIIEHLGQELVNPIWGELKNTLLVYLGNSSPEVRQAAVYGLGVFSMKTKSGFEECSSELLQSIDAAINLKSEDDDEDELGHCRDNCISSLGKIIVHQSNKIKNIEQWINKWVEYLPLRYDEEEAISNHELFFKSFISNPEIFLGKNYSHLFNIIRINATIFKSRFSNSSIDEMIIKISKGLFTNNQIMELAQNGVSMLHENLRNKFKEILA